MRFQHRTGERPLPGYTIKRGVGQGGFGEVYFAVSDAGKEVALKLLRGASDIELRGVANCLNLKHPNLVHIYDLKTDDRGGQWLVMEYVLGESLAQVLDRHPKGLPQEVAVEWFRGLAKAVSYLHDHGVVHRDLKPANIFIEHGNLKVGDYGLCKAMSASGRPQTRAVGTVHYMAPEISNGLYTKSIDIYACGVILFEMLTGRPPFEGETDAEVLMKHLTADANVEQVPPAFREIVARALDKTPERRFDSMADMLRAVEGVAGSHHTATSVGGMAAVSANPPPATSMASRPNVTAQPPIIPVTLPVARPVTRGLSTISRDRLTDLAGAMSWAPLVAAVVIVPWAALTGNLDDWTVVGKAFLLTLAISWAGLLAVGNSSAKPQEAWGKRVRLALLGLLIGVFAFWLDGYANPQWQSDADEPSQTETYLFGHLRMTPEGISVLGHYSLYFAATLGLIRWWRVIGRDRKQRFSLLSVVAIGIGAAILSFLWPWHSGRNDVPEMMVVPLAGIVVQWVSPWTPPPPPMPKRLRWKG